MKAIVLIASLFLSFSAQAQSLFKEVVMSESVHNLPVDVSTAKLKITTLGYGVPTLKVLVPEMADVTLLNHRNEGEEAPCIATYESMNLDDIIQGNPAVENVDFTITRTKMLQHFPGDVHCQVSVREDIHANIRGFNFYHSKTESVGTRHPDDCK